MKIRMACVDVVYDENKVNYNLIIFSVHFMVCEIVVFFTVKSGSCDILL